MKRIGEDAPQKYWKWDEATSKWVETTKDDPARAVYKDEVDAANAKRILMIALVSSLTTIITFKLLAPKSR